MLLNEQCTKLFKWKIVFQIIPFKCPFVDSYTLYLPKYFWGDSLWLYKFSNNFTLGNKSLTDYSFELKSSRNSQAASTKLVPLYELISRGYLRQDMNRQSVDKNAAPMRLEINSICIARVAKYMDKVIYTLLVVRSWVIIL